MCLDHLVHNVIYMSFCFCFLLGGRSFRVEGVAMTDSDMDMRKRPQSTTRPSGTSRGGSLHPSYEDRSNQLHPSSTVEIEMTDYATSPDTSNLKVRKKKLFATKPLFFFWWKLHFCTKLFNLSGFVSASTQQRFSGIDNAWNIPDESLEKCFTERKYNAQSYHI